MTAKKIIRKIHLWLGLSSGLVVLFLGLTGCILAFEIEIRSLTESYQKVKAEDKEMLPPSAIKSIAENCLVSKKALSVEYPAHNKAAVAAYYDSLEYELIYINPYTGAALHHKNMNKDFFRFILDGHFYLWLPENIGQPIVASATLIFLVVMISGLILWWPKNRAANKQRFSIKWTARWRRKNYDLHNVLGFYMTWIAIFIAITGLVWGFEWFAKSFYWATSGGKAMPEHIHPVSDTLMANGNNADIADRLWMKMSKQTKADESIAVYYPLTNTDPLEIGINHRQGTYYNADYYHYDQYTGQELEATGTYAGSFEDASFADKLKRMNYDIHVGSILGLPGKILAFLASLVAASLPVTGFIIWRGRRKKKRQPVKEQDSSEMPDGAFS